MLDQSARSSQEAADRAFEATKSELRARLQALFELYNQSAALMPVQSDEILSEMYYYSPCALNAWLEEEDNKQVDAPML